MLVLTKPAASRTRWVRMEAPNVRSSLMWLCAKLRGIEHMNLQLLVDKCHKDVKKRGNYIFVMAHSHTRRWTRIPVQGWGPFPKMATVVI